MRNAGKKNLGANVFKKMLSRMASSERNKHSKQQTSEAAAAVAAGRGVILETSGVRDRRTASDAHRQPARERQSNLNLGKGTRKRDWLALCSTSGDSDRLSPLLQPSQPRAEGSTRVFLGGSGTTP